MTKDASQSARDEAQSDFARCLTKDEPLAARTYYRMGGTAAWFAAPRSLLDLARVLEMAQERGLPLAVLGSGSNSVFADGRFEGIVVSLERFAGWRFETTERLFVEAAVTNTEVAEACLDAGRAGCAWMYRMPGQMGASVRMNARCYGGEVSQVVFWVLSMDIERRLRIWRGDEVFFGYKDTRFMKEPELVLGAWLHLPESKPRHELLAQMEACERDRHGKHHFDLPSCGSTFKNNYAVGQPSGRIFDALGFKGKRVGDIEVSQFHANFLWNLGRARTADLMTLTAQMRGAALASDAKADLELEVQPIGRFSRESFDRCAMERLGPSVEDEATGLKWCGLLSHPAFHTAGPPPTFPRTLLHMAFSPCVSCEPGDEMPEPGPDVRVILRQLRPLAAARLAPDEPFLSWMTQGDENVTRHFPLHPEAPSGTFLDGLWTSSVTELFLAHPDSPESAYLEFEMTPEGHWLALAFESVRKRRPAEASAALWPGVARSTRQSEKEITEEEAKERTTSAFGMTFSLSTLADVVSADGRVRVLAALSLGQGRYFIAPHWRVMPDTTPYTNRGPANERADFHQPARYWPMRLA